MPVGLGIWKISGGLEPVVFSTIETERKLEDALHQDISVLDPSLMVVGRQVATDYGGIIDLLAVDAQGELVVVELKRDRTPRDVVAQLLDYGSWVEGLTYEQVARIYADKHPGRSLEHAFEDRFQTPPPEALNDAHRLVVVATALDPSTERIIGHLSDTYGVPVNAVFFRYFEAGGEGFLARTWLIDPSEAEAQASKAPSPQRKREPWNGRDYYVSVGEGPHRTWADCVRYGFVSAGQGKWYSQSLKALDVGHRVFACVPGAGYVGVGTVTEQAVPASEFEVVVDGQAVPVLDAPLEAPQMAENAGDPDLSEYVVRVDWERTVPVAEARWEKGMFANQNSACRLRNRFTLERLAALFELGE